MNVQPLLPSSLNQSCNISTGLMSPSPSYQDQGRNSRLGNGPFCLMSYAVTREDVDVVSVRFRPLDRVLVLVQSDTPSVMQLYLNTGMDSGGSLTISLWANQVLCLQVPCGPAQLGLGLEAQIDLTLIEHQLVTIVLNS